MAQPDQVDIIIADLDLFTRFEVITLGLNINANLREDTPRDTGWAAANWVPSVGEPFPGSGFKKDPTPADVQARAQQAAEGANEVLAWQPEQGPIFSANNVPYIGALNAGHSPQAAPGFVLRSIERAIRQTESRGANQAARNRRAESARSSRRRPVR